MINRGPSAKKGASLPMALLLFLFCALAAWAALAASNLSASRAARLRELEKQYASAASAARLVRDSMTDQLNVLTVVFLQTANGEDGVLTVRVECDSLPPAECEIRFDPLLNLDATVKTGSLTLRLTIPATEPGVPGWSRENAFFERIEGGTAEDVP